MARVAEGEGTKLNKRLRHSAAFLLSLAIQSTVGVSLGLYYTAVFYGRGGVPLPTPVSLSAPILYYVSVGSLSNTVYQSTLWVGAFPVSAVVWAAGLWIAGQYLGIFSGWYRLLKGTALASLPLVAPAPGMAWILGQTSQGWSLQKLLDACLRDTMPPSSPAMNTIYVACALISLVLEYRALQSIAAGRIRRVVLPALLFLVAVTPTLGLLFGWIISHIPVLNS